MKPKESQIQKSILDWLALQPDVFAWRSPNHAVFDFKRQTFRRKAAYQRGVPDIIGICKINGRVYTFALEVKRPGGKLSDEQREWLARFNDKGGYGYMVDSLEDTIEIFEKELRYK